MKRLSDILQKAKGLFKKHKGDGHHHWRAGKWSCTDRDDGMSYEPSLWCDLPGNKALCIVINSTDEEVAGMVYSGDEFVQTEENLESAKPAYWSALQAHDAAQVVSRKLGGPVVPLSAIQKIWKLKGW